MKLVRLSAIPLQARFADEFVGEVPLTLRVPASHFRRIPRIGQFATLVEAESDDGLIGYGEAFGLPHPMAAASIIEHIVAPALLGMPIGRPGEMLADLMNYFSAMGNTRGATIEALSGVDIALWDLKARVAGVPLATLLGAEPGPVPTYVSPITFQDSPDQSAQVARNYVDQGFKAVKLKVGRGLSTDVDHVAAVRAAIGSSVPLYLDANCAYDVWTAIEVARLIEPYDVGWFEEPVPPEDPRELAAVRRASPVLIAGGENEFTQSGFSALVRAEAVDFLQPNITRAGGVSGLLALGELCAKTDVALAPHGVGGCIGVAAALHACRAISSLHSYEANRLLNPLRDRLGKRSFRIENGALFAEDAPGHGGEPRPEMLARYRFDRPTPAQSGESQC